MYNTYIRLSLRLQSLQNRIKSILFMDQAIIAHYLEKRSLRFYNITVPYNFKFSTSISDLYRNGYHENIQRI